MLKYTVHPIPLESELDKAIRPNVKYKWSDIYESEDALVAELVHIDTEIGEDVINPVAPFYKGYEFIHSFAKQLQKGKDLSDKQMTQAKRLAKEIRKATVVMNHVKKYNKIDPYKLTNVEIRDRYRYLKSKINHHIQYIENYEQQQNARKNNDILNKEIDTLRAVLKQRSNGICMVYGKYADIGDTYVHIIKKTCPTDSIVILWNNEIETCAEFQETDAFCISRNREGKINWIPVELENKEKLYHKFGLEKALLINKGYWFKVDSHQGICNIYDGDMYLGQLTNLSEDDLCDIEYFCYVYRRKYEIK